VQSKFSITILGNGSAAPHKNRKPSAQWLNIATENWLMDCGEGTQFSIIKQKLKKSKLTGICISHLHADHFLGIFGLLSTFSLEKRNQELIIIAPKYLKNMIEVILLQNNFSFCFEIRFIETDNVIEKTLMYENNGIKISAFPLKHRIFTTGFQFSLIKSFIKLNKEKINELDLDKKSKLSLLKGLSAGELQKDTFEYNDLTIAVSINKSYSYCSDTNYFDKLPTEVQQSDILYHEATFGEEKLERAFLTGHSTAKQAAKVALKSNAKKLLIGHFSSRYDQIDFLLDEAKEVFENTYIAEENTTYEI